LHIHTLPFRAERLAKLPTPAFAHSTTTETSYQSIKEHGIIRIVPVRYHGKSLRGSQVRDRDRADHEVVRSCIVSYRSFIGNLLLFSSSTCPFNEYPTCCTPLLYAAIPDPIPRVQTTATNASQPRISNISAGTDARPGLDIRMADERFALTPSDCENVYRRPWERSLGFQALEYQASPELVTGTAYIFAEWSAIKEHQSICDGVMHEQSELF
jgi:hypothetical protein